MKIKNGQGILKMGHLKTVVETVYYTLLQKIAMKYSFPSKNNSRKGASETK